MDTEGGEDDENLMYVYPRQSHGSLFTNLNKLLIDLRGVMLASVGIVDTHIGQPVQSISLIVDG